MTIETIGFIVMCALNIGAICYGYGVLNNRVKNCESDFRRAESSVQELFKRMNAIESLAGRLEEAAARWEKIMSNGINATIADIRDRLTRLEQHCRDKHGDSVNL